MDDHHFDAFVRAFAGRASRRGMLRKAAALAAATALAFGQTGAAGAHHGRILLGGACRQTSQCLHYATTRARARRDPQTVYCAYNGFHYDGDLNCCRLGGGSCTRDEHCCGDRHFCRSRVCTYLR